LFLNLIENKVLINILSISCGINTLNYLTFQKNHVA
jgi:hypothetical protein